MTDNSKPKKAVLILSITVKTTNLTHAQILYRRTAVTGTGGGSVSSKYQFHVHTF